jgi:hypothetical protein
MAKNQTKRISPAQLQADMDANAAIDSLPSYTPANSAYAQGAVMAVLSAMQSAQFAEVNAANALATARDAAAAAEWNFHNAILGVKEQVIAQYGKSSNEIQSLGLKKKTEYKAPKRKAKAA